MIKAFGYIFFLIKKTILYARAEVPSGVFMVLRDSGSRIDKTGDHAVAVLAT